MNDQMNDQMNGMDFGATAGDTASYSANEPLETLSDASDELDETAGESETPNTESDRRKPRGGVERRISKLVQERNALRRQLALRDGTSDVQPPDSGFDANQGEGGHSEPIKPEDVDRLVEHRIGQIVAQQELERVADNHFKRVEAAKANHPDWEEAVKASRDVPIHRGLSQVVMEQPNSAEVVYWLVNNPDVTEELNRMAPGRAIAEVGRISARLEAGRHSHPASNAPEPISPVRKLSSTSLGLRDEMPIGDWVKQREAALRRK